MKELAIKTPSAEYPIYITDSFDFLPDALKKAGLEGRRFCIITESNVAPLYLDTIKDVLKEWEISSYVFEAGEESKNLDTITDFYKCFLDGKLDRKSVLIALGGGVTGDMTGFAAATYMRGILFAGSILYRSRRHCSRRWTAVWAAKRALIFLAIKI